MKTHFVTFFAPGTGYSADEHFLQIDVWDVATALKLASQVKLRHGKKPDGFYFETFEDGELCERSNNYFFPGEILTLSDIRAENDPKNSTLIYNMETMDLAMVVRPKASGKALPLRDEDVVLISSPHHPHTESP